MVFFSTFKGFQSTQLSLPIQPQKMVFQMVSHTRSKFFRRAILQNIYQFLMRDKLLGIEYWFINGTFFYIPGKSGVR